MLEPTEDDASILSLNKQYSFPNSSTQATGESMGCQANPESGFVSKPMAFRQNQRNLFIDGSNDFFDRATQDGKIKFTDVV